MDERGVAAREAGDGQSLGRVSRAERNVLVAFGVTVLLWILPGLLAIAGLDDTGFARGYEKAMPEGVAAMVGALLLFVLPDRLAQPALHADLGRSRPDRLGHRAARTAVGWRWASLAFSTGLAEAMGRGITAWLPSHTTTGADRDLHRARRSCCRKRRRTPRRPT